MPRRRKTWRSWVSALFFAPILFFCFDLANDKWVDSTHSYSTTNAGLGLNWKVWIYYVVASLCGAVSGVFFSLEQGHHSPETVVDWDWLAGMAGGAIGQPCGLACTVLYLNSVHKTFSILVFLVAMCGTMISGGLVYYIVRTKCLAAGPALQQQAYEGVQMADTSGV